LATISFALCSPIPGRPFKKLKSPSSIALAISEMGLFRALSAARGPMPETVIKT